MDATFLAKIKRDYPWIKFKAGRKFSFRFPDRVTIGPHEDSDELLLLHEVGHALCKHSDFKTDIERLRCEREAWNKARELCPVYGVFADEELIEAEMETYREWLHQKSRCPKCRLTRFQTPDGVYHCPLCENFD